MNEIKIFDNEEFGTIRTVTIDNVVWFVASDICKALRLTNPTMAVSRLDEDERAKFNLGVHDSDGTNCINEYGLYNLVLASKKKEAKVFKRWITHEVLPSIRQNGGYINNQENLTPEQIVANALIVAQNIIKEKDKQITEMQPKALFADAVSSSHTSILIGDLAKLICQNGVNIGQKRLFEWLRANGYLIKRKGSDWNMPTQKSIEMGLFEIKESSRIDANGCNVTIRTPKATGKGQVYFINKFLATSN